MAVEETADRLSVRLGISWFNGTDAVFDRATGKAHVRTVTFFWSKTLEIELKDIAAVQLVRQQSAAYARLCLASGEAVNLPSFGIKQGEQAATRIHHYLGLG